MNFRRLRKALRPTALRTQIASLLCIYLTLSAAHAEEVRLTALLELAMRQHPTILQARSQAEVAGFNLEAAEWGRFPTPSVELRSDSTYTQSIARVEQPVWSWGRIEGRIEYEQANLSSARAALRDAEQNALTQASTAFFEILRQAMRLKTAHDNIREHRQLCEMIQRRADSQISPTADVTLAQARLQQALMDRLQTQRQLENARNSLIQWAGPLNGEPQPPRRIDYRPPSSPGLMVKQSIEFSGQRKKLTYQVESATAQIRIAQAQGLPTLVSGYQHVMSGYLTPGAERGHVYFGVQYQPGAGLSARSGISAAVARKEAAEFELQGLERTLTAQVNSLQSDVEQLQGQLATAQDLVNGTGEIVDSYVRQYQIGRKNWLDVLNAVREKTQATYNLADVRYTLLQSQVRLMLLSGDLRGGQLTSIHE